MQHDRPPSVHQLLLLLLQLMTMMTVLQMMAPSDDKLRVHSIQTMMDSVCRVDVAFSDVKRLRCLFLSISHSAFVRRVSKKVSLF